MNDSRACKKVLMFLGMIIAFQWHASLQAQENEVVRLTVFDSLFQSGSHIWFTGNTAPMANLPILDMLAGLYPEGITHEQVDYDGKHISTTERWIVVRGGDCSVFEFKRWEWGGVFGFINGVNVLDIKDFKSRLEREVGKVDLGE